MDGETRRKEIIHALNRTRKPVSASVLAKRFEVSRQIIVGDIALLRAQGYQIVSTPRGYAMPQEPAGLKKTVACRHDAEGMRNELYAMVDEGCRVVNVIIDHPIYGQLTGTLNLASRHDVDLFCAKCASKDAEPLSALTSGIHLHTLICPDEDSYQRVLKKLDELGVLLH